MLSVISKQKGYNPFVWFLAGSILGIFVLGFLPFTNEIDIKEKERRNASKKKGNIIGMVLSVLTVMLYLFLQ